MATAANDPTPVDFARLMPQVAPLLLGEPNKAMSTATRLRFGAKGSVEVDPRDGWFDDYEANIRGGVLELIRHKRGVDTVGAFRWLEEQGLKERDAAPQRSRGVFADAVYGRASEQVGGGSSGPAFYDYRDENGDVLFRVERRGKDAVPPFLAHGPDGRGGFHSARGCMQGVRRVPYRLPELLASDRDTIVFVTEGEKDADRLTALGLVATTNPGGAGKFTAPLAEHLRGRRVIALQDNDKPGRDHVEQVQKMLTGIARQVAALLLPNLPAKGDVSDWLDRDGSADELVAQGKAALAQVPGPKPLVAATLYVWCDPTKIPEREWVYGRSIQRSHVRAIVAAGAAGKTILSVGEALAMVTGRNLLGQDVPGGPKRVWLWNLEDDREELTRIIQAACKHWSITEAEIGGRLFVDSALDGAVLKLATSTASDGLVMNRPLVEALTAELQAREIDYLHVDPFVSSHAANESDNMEIDAITKEWALVAKNAGCGIGLAHHVSKAGAGEVTALSARGAVALVNACRSVLTLNRMSEEEAKRFGIEEERRRRFFRVYDDKNNRAPPADASNWFQMASVSLDNDPLGGGGDNMGVVIPWSPPDAFEGVTADDLLRIQRIVDQGSYRADVQAKDWVGKVVAGVLNLSPDSSAKSDRVKLNRLLGTWFETGALTKVDGKDGKGNVRTFVEVGDWAVQDVAPTSKGEVGKGVEGGVPQSPHPTCPPLGAGVGKAASRQMSEVGKAGRRVVFGEDGSTASTGTWKHGNPVLGPAPDDDHEWSSGWGEGG